MCLNAKKLLLSERLENQHRVEIDQNITDPEKMRNKLYHKTITRSIILILIILIISFILLLKNKNHNIGDKLKIIILFVLLTS